MRASFVARLLDPLSRLVEAIYSVLIVLTFTLAVSVAAQSASGDAVMGAIVRNLAVAAFGCALAWGIIDGVMYVLTALFERGQQYRLLQSIRTASSEEAGVTILAGELDETLQPLADEDQRAQLYQQLFRRLRSTPPPVVGFKREDFAGALGVLLVAAGAALPVVLPLLLLQGNPTLAIRASNLVAFGMLFWMGYRWAKHAGAKPVKTGLLLAAVGAAMMLVAIPLGG